MKYYVTGVDIEGKSCVLEERTVEGQPETPTSTIMFTTDLVPPAPRPTGAAMDHDLKLAPGHTRFFVFRVPSDRIIPMHHTDTVDYDVVVSGSVDLVLDRGDLHLEAGEAVVVPGVDHGWRPGPEGYVLAVTMIGTVPPKTHSSGA